MRLNHKSITLSLGTFLFFPTGFLAAQTVPVPTSMPSAISTKIPVPPQAGDFHPTHTPTPGKVRLAFGGDINLARLVGKLIKQNGKNWPFEKVKPLLDQADLVVANLESPVGKGGKAYTKKEVYLKGSVDSLDALSYAGIGLMTVSNNHILDYGPGVARQTLRGLSDRGIESVGWLEKADGTDPTVYLTINGVKLAFLAFCGVCPGTFDAKRGKAGIESTTHTEIIPRVQEARKNADFVVVLVHWGWEYGDVGPIQKKKARVLCDAGADLVVGCHPHVLQKIRRIKKGLVAYSLGNFLFDLRRKETLNSCVLMVDLEKGKAPAWTAYPLSLESGRPEPIPQDDPRFEKIQQILASPKTNQK